MNSYSLSVKLKACPCLRRIKRCIRCKILTASWVRTSWTSIWQWETARNQRWATLGLANRERCWILSWMRLNSWSCQRCRTDTTVRRRPWNPTKVVCAATRFSSLDYCISGQVAGLLLYPSLVTSKIEIKSAIKRLPLILFSPVSMLKANLAYLRRLCEPCNVRIHSALCNCLGQGFNSVLLVAFWWWWRIFAWGSCAFWSSRTCLLGISLHEKCHRSLGPVLCFKFGHFFRRLCWNHGHSWSYTWIESNFPFGWCKIRRGMHQGQAGFASLCPPHAASRLEYRTI
jgi:hypothetical protein